MKLNTKYFTIAVYVLAVLALTILFLLVGLNWGPITLFVGGVLSKISALFYAIAFALILLPFVKLCVCFLILYGDTRMPAVGTLVIHQEQSFVKLYAIGLDLLFAHTKGRRELSHQS